MTRYEPIGELDLHAYADGLVEGDARRRAEIERYLAGDRDAAALVAEIQAQNRAIRGAYGSAIALPVPDRLMAVVTEPPRRQARALVGASAAAVLLLAGVGAGWLAGQRDDPDRLALERFASAAAAQHRVSAIGSGVQPAALATETEPLAWLNERFALEIEAPDLTDQGFTLVGKSRVGRSEDGGVQLVYRDEAGALLSLFLRPRWEERADPIEVVRSDGIAVHYWLDGPLAFALASNAPVADTERLAKAVRDAVGRSRLADATPEQTMQIPSLRGFGLEGSALPALSSEPVSVESNPRAPQAH